MKEIDKKDDVELNLRKELQEIALGL